VSREEKAQAEQLKKHGDVKEALEQALPPPAAPERVGFPKSNMR
jgi:hypothetical protein